MLFGGVLGRAAGAELFDQPGVEPMWAAALDSEEIPRFSSKSLSIALSSRFWNNPLEDGAAGFAGVGGVDAGCAGAA